MKKFLLTLMIVNTINPIHSTVAAFPSILYYIISTKVSQHKKERSEA